MGIDRQTMYNCVNVVFLKNNLKINEVAIIPITNSALLFGKMYFNEPK